MNNNNELNNEIINLETIIEYLKNKNNNFYSTIKYLFDNILPHKKITLESIYFIYIVLLGKVIFSFKELNPLDLNDLLTALKEYHIKKNN